MPQETAEREKILKFLRARPKGRFTPKEILKGARTAAADLDAITQMLRGLAREGLVVRLKKNHYAAAGAAHGVVGRVQAHPGGFGFFIPEDKGQNDLYLNRREMRRVMHGDKVLARVEKKRVGAAQAHVVQILERGQRRLLGTYEERMGRGWLVPMDRRVGAVPLETDDIRPAAGTVVAAEIVRYGTALSPPQARLVEALGDPDDPEVQTRAVIFRYELPSAFSTMAEREAEEAARGLSSQAADRVDLRALSMVTIDGEQARDFDDAVYVEGKNGAYHLYVSIADVAHYVTPETILDREAYERGTSVYFPDRALPMLPTVLSNGVCSLNPDEERLAKTAEIEIAPNGEIIGSRFFNSIIRSHRRMTYTEVRRILVDRDPDCLDRHRDLVESFKLMEELALLLQERRRARGSLDFDLPEAEIILDLQGAPENIVRAERNIAHRIIEEFMIEANEAVARYLKEKGFPFLYRVHAGPDPETLRALLPFLLSLGYRLPLRKKEIEPKDIQELLDKCRGKPAERVLNRVLLRAMKQARYSPQNIGHFGLASRCYAHFTSPIRRYPDLIVHRMLELALLGRKLKPKEVDDLSSYLEEAAEHTSNRERRAMEAEREMVDLKKAQFITDKIGQEFLGFVVSLTSFGFFVELESFFVEGLVRLASLTDDTYRYYEKEYLIKGMRNARTFRLGDPVRVKVARIHAFRGEIDFQLLGKADRA
jgi:ribonuclease R